VAVAAGNLHALALRADGSVFGWGDNAVGEIEIPASATNVTAIAAAGQHSLALRRDGSVVAWGSNLYGESDVPPSATNVVAIADSGNHCLALRADGTVVTWGYDDQFHLLRVPASATNVVAIAAKELFSAVVRRDGSVLVWGLDLRATVTLIPPSATNLIAIAAGGESYGYYLLGLKADGSVVGWGQNDWGQATAPAGLNEVDLPVSISGGLNVELPGTYTLTYTVTNILGEVGTATRKVSVVDTTPPFITCPTNITAEPTSSAGSAISFSVQAADLCSGTSPVICDPPSGSTFPIGATPVLCTAVDDSGNVSQCALSITVVNLRSVKMNVLAEMTKAAQSIDNPLLDRAIKALTRSTTAAWWRNDLSLESNFGGRLFHAEAETVVLLHSLQAQRQSRVPATMLQDWIERLVRVDRILAVTAVEAASRGAHERDLAGARDKLKRGDQAVATQKYSTAILLYEEAWRQATHHHVHAITLQ
jgi:hypothetical protein